MKLTMLLIKVVLLIQYSKKKTNFWKIKLISEHENWQVMLKRAIFLYRGKYFAERASICDGHFWCALGQNSWFLVGKLQNFDNFMENN